MKTRNVILLLVCLAISYAFAGIGSLFTDTSGWYASVKPSITPPNYVFPIVWSILFFLIGLSLFFSWTRSQPAQKPAVAILFAVNLVLNALWTIFFFGLHSPQIAMLDLVLLWLTIWALVSYLWHIDKKASLLLVPYGLWVTFAGLLNAMIAGFWRAAH